MVLSYSRDPFCCCTTSMNAATWWDCHRRALAHFGGVPAAIVYDRTKTIVKRHVRSGVAVPLHPDAAAFAEQNGFVPDVLAVYRPTGKGRVKRQVQIVREHVLAARSFTSIARYGCTFLAWVLIRRAQMHRTYGEVIAVRADTDRAALVALPAVPYLVADPGAYAGSVRTAWSRSKPASTPCQRSGCRPGSGLRSAPAWTPSPSTPLPSTPPRSRPACSPLACGPAGQVSRRPDLLGRTARPNTPERPPSIPAYWCDGHETPRRRAGTVCPHCSANTRWGQCGCRAPAVGVSTTVSLASPRPRALWRRPVVSELIATRMKDYCLRLGVTHIADSATQLAARAEADNIAYLDLIDLLLEEELGLREGRWFRNALKLSGLPPPHNDRRVRLRVPTDLDPGKVRDLAALTFVADNSNVALLGPGSGRSTSPSPWPSRPARPGA
jgi:hypothetical protein